MTPEIAVERVRGFLRWCSEKFEHLDGQQGTITDPLGWRRGAEFWVPPGTWHQIFDNDEDAALLAAQALRDNGLLRTQAGPSLQCNVKIRKEVRRCYCVSEKILTWKPPNRGSNGSNAAQIGLPYGQGPRAYTPLPPFSLRVRIVHANGCFAAHVQCDRFSAQFDGNDFAVELHE
jgi:hypothetical protein